MTTSTIGASSRNYATITLWQAALPTSGSGTWDGVLYNDAEFLNESPGSGALNVGGSTNWPETLTPATGQSAFDAANSLKYDVSKGVGIRSTNSYSQAFKVTGSLTARRIQVCQAGSGNNNTALQVPFTITPVLIDRCLFQQDSSGGNAAVIMTGTNGSGTQKMTNSVIIANAAGMNGINLAYSNGTTIANVTIVKASNVSGSSTSAIVTQGGAPKITNCAMFGFANAVSVISGTPTGTNNATDAASIGFTSASSLTSQTYANQFTGVTTTGGLDFRLKSGNSLDGAGATDTTDIPAAIDIFATARTSGSWSIGAHQPASAGTTIISASACRLETLSAIRRGTAVPVERMIGAMRATSAQVERRSAVAASRSEAVERTGATERSESGALEFDGLVGRVISAVLERRCEVPQGVRAAAEISGRQQGSVVAPVEYLGTASVALARDVVALLEWGTKMSGAGSVPCEGGAVLSLLRGAGLESSAALRREASADVERLTAVQVYVKASPEVVAAVGASQVVPAEWLGTAVTAIASNAKLALEILGSSGRASAGGIDAGSIFRSGQSIPAERQAKVIAAALTRAETVLRAQGAPSSGPIEVMLLVAGRATIGIAWDGTTLLLTFDPEGVIFGRDRKALIAGQARETIIFGTDRKAVIIGR